MSTQNIPFSIQKKKNYIKLSQICSCGIFSMGLKNEFETSVVNEPSVFEPPKFDCICSADRYWSEILCSTIRSPGHDLLAKV